MTNTEIKTMLETLTSEEPYSISCKIKNKYRLNIKKLNLENKKGKKTRIYSTLYLMDRAGDDFTNGNGIPNIKYAMFVYDENNETSDEELYIVIGQNPSYSFKNNIDRTNQCIYKALICNGIHRYLLLNTFPIIDADGVNSPDVLKTKENLAISKTILNSLFGNVKIKILFACGSSLPVYAQFINDINEFAAIKKIDTNAFEYNKRPQTHMSIQTINSQKIDLSLMEIKKYTVSCIDSEEFKKAKFEKGE